MPFTDVRLVLQLGRMTTNLVAAGVPVRRAAPVDPIVALRTE